ncbi:hypothetical protein [Kitasatospora sp. NPDC048407]|uniref:hypothetical protein n=1 Tax=Kitasatospora sp. NPDC048407 TaxID=3364051 RepID=UPI003710FF9E
MELFACAHCASTLTRPVSRVRFPPYARHQVGNGLRMPALMDAGSYAVDPEQSGPPWRLWEELADGEAEARGYYDRVYSLPDGPRGQILLAPGDDIGTTLIVDGADGYCCGLTGGHGPNLACAHCGLPVGAREDDCSVWQAVWLQPDAVRAVPAGPDLPVTDWDGLIDERYAVPPVDAAGRWDRRCEQEMSTTLVGLALAAGGAPVAFDDGEAAAVFDRAMRHFPPDAGRPAKRCALHGPGRPLAGRHPELALVPRHPQTGRPWPTPPGVTGIPLDLAVWRHLAFPRMRAAVRVHSVLRAELDRDDPPLPTWRCGVYFDGWLIHDLLARVPADRRPAVRAIHPGWMPFGWC